MKEALEGSRKYVESGYVGCRNGGYPWGVSERGPRASGLGSLDLFRRPPLPEDLSALSGERLDLKLSALHRKACTEGSVSFLPTV